LPDRFKLNGLNEKFILKKLSKGRIPESISNRSKQAYRAPISDSFFNQKVPDIINDMLSSNSIKSQGIFDVSKVENLVSKMKQNKSVSEIEQMAVVGIISTQLMSNIFIKNKLNPNPDKLQNYRLIVKTGEN